MSWVEISPCSVSLTQPLCMAPAGDFWVPPLLCHCWLSMFIIKQHSALLCEHLSVVRHSTVCSQSLAKTRHSIDAMFYITWNEIWTCCERNQVSCQFILENDYCVTVRWILLVSLLPTDEKHCHPSAQLWVLHLLTDCDYSYHCLGKFSPQKHTFYGPLQITSCCAEAEKFYTKMNPCKLSVPFFLQPCFVWYVCHFWVYPVNFGVI